MIDFGLLTKVLVAGWPLLSTAGSKVMDGFLEKLGDEGVEVLKKLVGKLRPGIESKPTLIEPLQKTLAEPNNPDRQTVLKVALQDWLESDPTLLKEVATLLARVVPAERVKYQVNAEKIYGQAVGDNPRVIQYFKDDAEGEHP